MGASQTVGTAELPTGKVRGLPSALSRYSLLAVIPAKPQIYLAYGELVNKKIRGQSRNDVLEEKI